ncbi:phosphomannomutase/phosphoglucomutase [Candidatus Uhrbacteria bacterium]|nr:phosphomannomutase/phosphoglucomutase [Candidatus Uhrbacteria bacterium]
MNTSIFKAYDIRGLSPQELDADTAYRVGQAVVKFTRASTVVVGRDMRDTSPALFEAVARGIMSQGADVVDIGLVTTPMFYFAVAEYDLHDAGMMITASHNPKEYNGLKLCYDDALPIGAASGMDEIRDLALAGPYPEKKSGTMVETDIREDYVAKLLAMIDVRKLERMNVVVDTANGMEGCVIADIFGRVRNVTMTGLFLDLDGAFPNHEANPLKEETLEALKAKVRELRAHAGFAFDGDGDRVGLVDEQGENVRGDLLLALVAGKLLRDNPGQAVLYDVRCSLAVAEEIERAGGVPTMCRVGHGFIKPQMREMGALFAGELSNHFYFRDMYGAESTDLVMLTILELLSETGKPLSELVAPLKRYHHSGEINSKVAGVAAVMARLEQTYAHEAAAVTKIDGLRLDFGGDQGRWWFSVRASNTEPLLRLNVEAADREMMEKRRDELLALIRS